MKIKKTSSRRDGAYIRHGHLPGTIARPWIERKTTTSTTNPVSVSGKLGIELVLLYYNSAVRITFLWTINNGPFASIVRNVARKYVVVYTRPFVIYNGTRRYCSSASGKPVTEFVDETVARSVGGISPSVFSRASIIFCK